MSWFLVFERTNPQRAPGAATVMGAAAGSGQSRPPQWRTFQNVMVVEARDWDHAFEQAVKLTGRLGEWAAIPCEVFIPEMIQVRAQRRGTDGTGGTV